MRPPAAAALLPLLALVACQTPREACLAEAGGELRTVEALIRETEGNLRRGYAIEEEQEVRVVRTTCEVELEDGTEGRVPCDRTDVEEVERPVAIDLGAERVQLDGLLEQRGRLLAQAAARRQACLAAHPE